MRHWRQFVIDIWGALAYKPAFQAAADGRPTRLPGPMAASWLPDSERRRLAASAPVPRLRRPRPRTGRDGEGRMTRLNYLSAGAVRATFPGCEDAEDEEEELARRLFTAVGERLGLSLPRREIEQGLLPAVHLPSPV